MSLRSAGLLFFTGDGHDIDRDNCASSTSSVLIVGSPTFSPFLIVLLHRVRLITMVRCPEDGEGKGVPPLCYLFAGFSPIGPVR